MVRVGPNWVHGRCLPGKPACLSRNVTDLMLHYPFTAGVYGSRFGMESFPSSQSKHPINSYFSSQWKKSHTLGNSSFRILIGDRLLSLAADNSRAVSYSKRSIIQDFQDFVNPKQLLPANEANVYTAFSLDELCASLEMDCSCAYYIVQLNTSSDLASGLSEMSSAILLCLIDVNENSILQRIPAALTYKQETKFPDFTPFQRNSSDWIVFKGSPMDDIEAVWISTEKGCWRIGGMNLIVMQPSQPSFSSMGDCKFSNRTGVKYSFDAPDVLLGERGDMSMTELRPAHITTINGAELLTLLKSNISPYPPLYSQMISSEESMKEYSNLKISLLLYDSLLVLAGTWLLTFAKWEISEAFFIGGVCGFLYLLLLQRSVDGLSMSDLRAMNDKETNPIQLLGGFKGPLTKLALVFLSTALVLKYGVGNSIVALKPEDLLAGVAGFLACKIAVILAAFKPVLPDTDKS